MEEKLTFKEMNYETLDYDDLDKIFDLLSSLQVDLDNSRDKFTAFRKNERDLIKKNRELFTRDKDNLLVSNTKTTRKILFFEFKKKFSDEVLAENLKDVYEMISYCKKESLKAKNISYALMQMYIKYQTMLQDEHLDNRTKDLLKIKIPNIQATLNEYFKYKEAFDKLDLELEKQVYGPEFDSYVKTTYKDIEKRVEDSRKKIEKGLNKKSITDKIMASNMCERLSRDEEYLDFYFKTMLYRNGDLTNLSAEMKKDITMNSYMFLLNLYNSSDKKIRKAFERSVGSDMKDTFSKVVFSMSHDLMKDFFLPNQKLSELEEAKLVLSLQLEVISQLDNLNDYLTEKGQTLSISRLDNGNIEMTITSNSFDMPETIPGQSAQFTAANSHNSSYKIIYNEHTKKIENVVRTFEIDGLQTKAIQNLSFDEIVEEKEKRLKRPLSEDERKQIEERETKVETSLSKILGKISISLERHKITSGNVKFGFGLFSKEKEKSVEQKIDEKTQKETRSEGYSLGSVEIGASAGITGVKASADFTVAEGKVKKEQSITTKDESTHPVDMFSGTKTMTKKSLEASAKLGVSIESSLMDIIKEGKYISAKASADGGVKVQITTKDNKLYEFNVDGSIGISDDILKLKNQPMKVDDFLIKYPGFIEKLKTLNEIFGSNPEKKKNAIKSTLTSISPSALREELDVIEKSDGLKEIIKETFAKDNGSTVLYTTTNDDVSKGHSQSKKNDIAAKLDRLSRLDESKNVPKSCLIAMTDKAISKCNLEKLFELSIFTKKDAETFFKLLNEIDDPEKFESEFKAINSTETKPDVKKLISDVYKSRMITRIQEVIENHDANLLEFMGETKSDLIKEALNSDKLRSDLFETTKSMKNPDDFLRKVKTPSLTELINTMTAQRNAEINSSTPTRITESLERA